MKPVSAVHFATARSNKGIRHPVEHFDGSDRIDVKVAAVTMALTLTLLREAV